MHGPSPHRESCPLWADSAAAARSCSPRLPFANCDRAVRSNSSPQRPRRWPRAASFKAPVICQGEQDFPAEHGRQRPLASAASLLSSARHPTTRLCRSTATSRTPCCPAPIIRSTSQPRARFRSLISAGRAAISCAGVTLRRLHACACALAATYGTPSNGGGSMPLLVQKLYLCSLCDCEVFVVLQSKRPVSSPPFLVLRTPSHQPRSI